MVRVHPAVPNKINSLGQTIAVEQIAVSALCPHSHCRTRVSTALMAASKSALYICAEGKGIHD